MKILQTDDDAQKQAVKTACYSGHGYEKNGHEQPDQNKTARGMAIGYIAGHGLYNKHQKAGDAGQKTHLGQAQSHLFHKHRKQGIDERALEVTAEVHQAERD